MNRVITFGCSHAWGAECVTASINDNSKNLNASFGKQVANKLGLEFAMAARSGVGNDQILFDVYFRII